MLHTDDEVYISDETLRDEYVQSDFGLVYAGWSWPNGPRQCRWNFGQVCSIMSDRNYII